MDLAQIRDLLKIVAESGVSEVEVEEEDFRLVVRKHAPNVTMQAPPPPPMPFPYPMPYPPMMPAPAMPAAPSAMLPPAPAPAAQAAPRFVRPR